MEKIWLKHYPDNIPENISIGSNSINELIAKSVKKYSNQIAFTNFGHDLTFSELDQLSDDFASYLQNHLNLKKGDRFAIQTPNTLQYPIALFGAIKAGLVVVNVNPLYTARELEHQLKDSGCKAILVYAGCAHTLEQVISKTSIEHVIVTEVGDMLPLVKRFLINSVIKHVKKMVPPYNIENSISLWKALLIGAGKKYTPVQVGLEDIVFLQYTGGTTGVSKGAILTHKNILSNIEQIFLWVKGTLETGKETIVTPLPLYHIFALTVNCFGFFALGTRNILITNPRDMKSFVKDLAKYPFSVLTGVNTLFNALLNNEEFLKLDQKNLKLCLAGGMALQDSVADEWKEKTGVYIVQAFGLTEASPGTHCNLIDNPRKGSIGVALPSTEVKIIGEDGQELGINEPGELCIKGPQVMRGYWQKEEETANTLIDGWLHTGDIAVVEEDGYARIVDRKKDLILVSGFNVFPNEIEDVVSKHKKVLEVAAIGVEDAKSGEVVKIFVVKNDPSLTEEELKQFCKENLTAYKVPKSIEFMKELPKTNVGKILRRALK